MRGVGVGLVATVASFDGLAVGVFCGSGSAHWYGVRISPNGRWLVVDSRNSLRIYSVASGRPVHDFRGHLGVPEWETGDHVMTSVADPIADRRALVRIDAHTGAFEQASPVQNVYGLTLAHH